MKESKNLICELFCDLLRNPSCLLLVEKWNIFFKGKTQYHFWFKKFGLSLVTFRVSKGWDKISESSVLPNSIFWKISPFSFQESDNVNRRRDEQERKKVKEKDE